VRGKQAKQLRRMARALTPDAPWYALMQGRAARIAFVPTPPIVDGGEPGKRAVAIVPHRQLLPESGKALYKRFKQGYRRLARKEAAAIQLLQKLQGAA
jgi:hypothetical protein